MFTRLMAAGLAATLALPAQASTLGDYYTSYYAFGDSLTDDGKFGILFPPSLGGRFSNGPTYAELVADRFEAAGRDTGNLALGGATGGPVNDRPLGPLATFGGQIAVFQQALANTIGLPTDVTTLIRESDAPTPGDNPLVSVLFGGNDFFQGKDLIAAADSVADGIRAIAATAGQSFDDFIVATLPDVGLTPAFLGAGSAFATAGADAFNTRLRSNITDLRAEGLRIIYFDSDAALQPLRDDIANGGPIYGVLDAVTPCTASLSDLGPFCANPDELLFTDGVHPNAVAQRVTGDAFAAAIAAVPLPAGAPLLLLGVAGLAGLRRRKAG